MTNSDDINNKIGVLLVNLGTPEQPTAKAVRKFLRQFLSDTRVIDLPKVPWQILLNAVILPLRCKRVAKSYQKVWMKKGSPLLLYSQAIVDALRQGMDESKYCFALGMTYGSPNLTDALLSLRAQGAKKLLVIPLYPQYSSTTSASVFDRVTNALQRCPHLPDFNFISNYAIHRHYINALAQSIKPLIVDKQTDAHILFSFHGLPIRYCENGDPYAKQCHETVDALVKYLNLKDGSYTLCYQSQFGKAKWLAPSTESTIISLAKRGCKSVIILCPGFAADCLETLEEVAIGLKATFLKHGGEAFTYIPALNDSVLHIELFKSLVVTHSQAWF